MKHIWRIAAGRNANSHVPRTPQSFNLSREDKFEPVVVCDRGDARCIHRQSQCGSRWAIEAETTTELRRNMLGIRRAATIAKQKRLIPLLQNLNKYLADLGDSRHHFRHAQQTLLCRNRCLDRSAYAKLEFVCTPH